MICWQVQVMMQLNHTSFANVGILLQAYDVLVVPWSPPYFVPASATFEQASCATLLAGTIVFGIPLYRRLKCVIHSTHCWYSFDLQTTPKLSLSQNWLRTENLYSTYIVDCKEASPFSKNTIIFAGCTICMWIAKRRAPSHKIRLFSQYVIYVYSICIWMNHISLIF